jgi:hypothetical protein
MTSFALNNRKIQIPAKKDGMSSKQLAESLEE